MRIVISTDEICFQYASTSARHALISLSYNVLCAFHSCTVRPRNLVDGLVTGDRLDRHRRLERTAMPPTLCHNSLLCDATVPQQYYLIHWSRKAGVLQSSRGLSL